MIHMKGLNTDQSLKRMENVSQLSNVFPYLPYTNSIKYDVKQFPNQFFAVLTYYLFNATDIRDWDQQVISKYQKFKALINQQIESQIKNLQIERNKLMYEKNFQQSYYGSYQNHNPSYLNKKNQEPTVKKMLQKSLKKKQKQILKKQKQQIEKQELKKEYEEHILNYNQKNNNPQQYHKMGNLQLIKERQKNNKLQQQLKQKDLVIKKLKDHKSYKQAQELKNLLQKNYEINQDLSNENSELKSQLENVKKQFQKFKKEIKSNLSSCFSSSLSIIFKSDPYEKCQQASKIKQLQNKKACKSCLDNCSDMIYTSCGHICICQSCAKQAQEKYGCIVCRDKSGKYKKCFEC